MKGQYAKYSYKLTIGIQKLSGNTQLLRLPFRVYSLLDFEKFIPKPESNLYENLNNLNGYNLDQEQEENPFEVVEKSEYENLEYALQILEDLTARMSTSKIYLMR